MKVNDVQKALKSGLNYFSKYKPSDLIVCEVGDAYQKNYWRSHPYLTLSTTNAEKCGIKLSQKSRGSMNKVIIKAEEPEDAKHEGMAIVEVRELKRLLTDASRELEKFIEDATIQSEFKSANVTTPFVCIYDPVDEEFHFISLNNLKITADEIVTVESKDFSFDQLKKLITESGKTPKREILEFAELWIDEEINEDNPDYTFRKVKNYARHGKSSGLDYVSIAIGVLDKFSKYMSPEANAILDDFVSTQENPENTKLVEDCIDFAVGQLAASISIDS